MVLAGFIAVSTSWGDTFVKAKVPKTIALNPQPLRGSLHSTKNMGAAELATLKQSSLFSHILRSILAVPRSRFGTRFKDIF